MAPALLALNARMFTLALPRIPAISASVPGRFSQEIVSCFALGTGVPPAGGFEAASYQRRSSRTTRAYCHASCPPLRKRPSGVLSSEGSDVAGSGLGDAPVTGEALSAAARERLKDHSLDAPVGS